MADRTEYMREYWSKPEIKEMKCQYYLENREKILQQRRNHYQKNKKRISARKRMYSQTEKGLAVRRAGTKKYFQTEGGKLVRKMIDANRKYLKRTQGTGITLQQWNELLEIYNHRCVYCGIHEIVLNVLGQKLTIDHVIPLSRGGEHSIENIVPACGECNSKKGVK